MACCTCILTSIWPQNRVEWRRVTTRSYVSVRNIRFRYNRKSTSWNTKRCSFFISCAQLLLISQLTKALFIDEKFKELSTDAKVLYGLLLDRMSLSLKNQWLDADNKVYIIFTTEEIMEALNCGNQKACRLMAELERNVCLIERRRQGLASQISSM